MLAQGGDSTHPTPPTDTPQAPTLTTQNPAPLPDFGGLSREELIALLKEEHAQNTVLELKLCRIERDRRGAVQESGRNDAGGDESVEEGRQLPQPLPQHVRPNIRMYLSDSQGMKVEHPSDLAWSMSRMGNRDHDRDHDPAFPTMVWSDQRALATPTMPTDERNKVLFQALKQCQEELKEMSLKYKESNRRNHSLVMELNACKMMEEESREQVAKVMEENASKDDIIKELKKQLQKAKNDKSRVSLRPGIKRGRFVMSKAPVLECTNCKEVFTSEDAANNTICCHHPQPACPLPNKMVAEMFPKEVSKQCYWPCCQKIDTKMPPPCQQGSHALQLV